MEDSQKLILELLAKLGELDSKVANYQQDMLAQFTKFSEDLLKDVPEAVSTEVSRAIAESMAKFPYLNTPSNRDESQPPTPTEADWKVWDGRKSPPPVLYHTSGIPKIFRADGGDRSPHERDKEFRGVFTPSYLPLLENCDRPQSTPASPRSPNPPSVPLIVPPADFLQLPDSIVADKEIPAVRAVSPEGQAGKYEEKEKDKELTLSLPLPVRKPPVRSMTDSSVLSMSSSGSGGETKTRRSALRRSSSSNKGSPRRVRFEFGGAEVLPSSSPDKDFGVESPLGSSLADEAESNDIQASSAIDDSELDDTAEPYSGPSLLDIEGEEDFEPRPKKVSSTQALRELSRGPLEEGTVWKTVNAETDNSVAATNGGSEATGSSDLTPTNSSMALSGSRGLTGAKNTAQSHHLNESVESLGSPLQEMERYSDDYDSSSEEEFLSMKPKSKSPSPATRSPRERSPATRLPHAEEAMEDLKPAPSRNAGKSQSAFESQPAQSTLERPPAREDTALQWDSDVMPRLRSLLKHNINCDYSVDVKNSHDAKGGPNQRVQRVVTVTLPVVIGTDVQDQIQRELLKSVAPLFANTLLKFNCPKPSARRPMQAEEPELFGWEEDGPGDKPAEKYLPEEDEDEEDTVDEPDTETETEADTAHKPTLYSTSPAMTIPGRDKPGGPTKTKFSEGGIGSYMDRTLHADVVRSPKVLEKAAALGDFQSFVGSVNGNSGFDPSDAHSYRASLGQHVFSGTPRSLSERMMLQDKMALERGEDLDDEDFPL